MEERTVKSVLDDVCLVFAMTVWNTAQQKTFNDLRRLQAQAAEHLGQVGFVDTEGTLLPTARNGAVRLAYKFYPDFTHLLFIDNDMCGFGINHLLILLSNGMDICGAATSHRKPPHEPTFYLDVETQGENNKKIFDQVISSPPEKKCLRVKSMGMGFTIISRSVFEHHDVVRDTPDGPVWFWGGFDDAGRLCGEDVTFCNSARKAGFSLGVDMRCEVGHIGEKPFTLYDWVAIISAQARQSSKRNRND